MGDLLKRQTMQAIVEKLEPNGAFIGELFFPMEEEATEESIWDIVKPGEGLAHFRATDAEAHIMGAKKFDQMKAKLADIAEKRRLNISDVRTLREAGENPILMKDGSLSGQLARKAQRKVTKEMARTKEVVDNRLEWMRINALMGGISYQDLNTGINISIDYGIPGGQKDLSPAVAWSTIATANPINDLQTWIETVADATGVEPATLITSRKALFYAGQSEVIKGYFKYTKPVLTAKDVKAIFNERLGLDVITYEARYTVGDTLTRFMPVNKLILLPDMNQMTGLHRFGDTAYIPHPHNGYKGSFYAWMDDSAKDPWGIEVGTGLTALPRVFQPEVELTADLW